MLRVLCSSKLLTLFSPGLRVYKSSSDSKLQSPLDILPLELTRFTISAAFPHPIPAAPRHCSRGEMGEGRDGSGQLRISSLPFLSFPFHPALRCAPFIFFLIRCRIRDTCCSSVCATRDNAVLLTRDEKKAKQCMNETEVD